MSSITRRLKAHITYTTEEIYNNSYSQEKQENQGDIEDGDKVGDKIRTPNGITKKKQEKKDLEGKPTTKSTLSYLGKKTTRSDLRPENIRNSAFYYPMKVLKKIFKIQFNLDFCSFKCSEVFGVSIRHMRPILDMKIYQILSYYPNYYAKIIEFANSKKSKENEYAFYYFMTRTYEELYTRYITGKVNFPCIPNGTVKQCSFTLKRAIEAKINELNEKNNNKEYINKYIDIFKNISENMIEDLKNGKNERVEKKEKEFTPVVCKEFEDKRNNFL